MLTANFFTGSKYGFSQKIILYTISLISHYYLFIYLYQIVPPSKEFYEYSIKSIYFSFTSLRLNLHKIFENCKYIIEKL